MGTWLETFACCFGGRTALEEEDTGIVFEIAVVLVELSSQVNLLGRLVDGWLLDTIFSRPGGWLLDTIFSRPGGWLKLGAVDEVSCCGFKKPA